MSADLDSHDWYALYEQALEYAGKNEGPVGRSTLARVTADRLDEPRSDAGARIDRAIEAGVLTRYGTRKQYLFDGHPETDECEYDRLLGKWDVDSERVQYALAEAAWWYHDQLHPIHVEGIEQRWGIGEEMVENLAIGWSTDGNGVIHHLREKGYDEVEIAAASVGTVTELKHVFRCDPDKCSHQMPDDIDALSRAVRSGAVNADEVDVRAVIDRAQDAGTHRIVDWWNNRLVFPYGDSDGNIRYLIARRTPQSNDVPGKYLKQQIRPYTDEQAVYEPIYGVHCLPDDPEYVVLTEGITDAIMAHQHAIPCLAPVTKQFKKVHHEPLREVVSRADEVYVVNDSEEDEVGLAGALRTASYLREQGVTAFVGEFPRGEDEKVDMADYLKRHSPKELENQVLSDAVPPEHHDKYEEYAAKSDSAECANSARPDAGGDAHEGTAQSGLFDLEITDIFDKDYRGRNPIRHIGDSENYFVVNKHRNGGWIATDFKGSSGDGNETLAYNGLTYAAAAARGQRAPPDTPLDDEDIFVAWLWAKRNRHLGSDDPCPSAGLRFIAREHTDLPARQVDQYPGEFTFPREIYNHLLEIVEEEYDVAPGRGQLPTNERDERRADLVMSEGEDGDCEDELVGVLKKVLAVSGSE